MPNLKITFVNTKDRECLSKKLTNAQQRKIKKRMGLRYYERITETKTGPELRFMLDSPPEDKMLDFIRTNKFNYICTKNYDPYE